MEGNAAACVQAANRDISDAPPGASQDCSTVVHIAVFFDGTGNNIKADLAEKKWSNVARLSLAAYDVPKNGMFAIYVSGVGTKFNGEAANWLDSGLVWFEDKVQGMGFGGGGDRRMNSGADNVNLRLRNVLIANARKAGGALKAYADEAEEASFAEVSTALREHRLIKMINLSVFGFSRGAALARAFSNRVFDKCKEEGDGLVYQEDHPYPFRLNFMGLFDTVASFGLPAKNLSLPWQERDLIVSPKVERCVHFVAGHEIRYSFPVDLIRKNGQMAGNFVETVYPGAHSDVGGGYKPQAQKIDDNYARIPMRDMMSHGIESGVRMQGYAELHATDPTTFSERFECRPETLEAYASYMNAYGAAGGTVESQVQRHMRLLYSTYGTMSRSGIETPGERQRKASLFKSLGPKGMAWEVKRYEKAAAADQWVRMSDDKDFFAQYVKVEDWQMEAWRETATHGATEFVAKYVHDSKVDFMGNIEPFSYFSQRGVAESTYSTWGGWFGNKERQAGNAVGAGAEVAPEKATEASDAPSRKAEAISPPYEYSRTGANNGIDIANPESDHAGEEARRMVENGTAWVAQSASRDTSFA